MLTADQAREVIAEVERDVKSPARRKSIVAFFAKNIAGKLSPEAVAVYQEYAA